MFEKENYVPNITYLLNSNSKVDFDQFKLAIEDIYNLKHYDHYFKFIIYSGENFHDYLKEEETVKLIKLSFKDMLCNTNSLIKFNDIETSNIFLKKELNIYKTRKVVRFTDKLLKFYLKLKNYFKKLK